MLWASVLYSTTAIDLKCLSYVNPNANCVIGEIDLKPVNSNEEVNIVIPSTWESSKVKTISIRTFDTPVPFPTKLFIKFPNVNETEIKTHLETITTEHLKQANALEKFDLGFNKISSIDDFAFNDAPNLKELILYYNQLTKIRKNTFAGLSSLLELYLNVNEISEIEENALNFPKLTLLQLQGNHLKVISDLSNPAHWNSLKHLNIGDNPWDAVDLKTFSQYAHLEHLNVSNSDLDLDALQVSADEIQSSKSLINDLNLSRSKSQSGIVFAKLKIFPNLQALWLQHNSLKTIDLDVLQDGVLPKLSLIWIQGNSFDDQWLKEAAGKVSLKVNRIELEHYSLTRD